MCLRQFSQACTTKLLACPELCQDTIHVCGFHAAGYCSGLRTVSQALKGCFEPDNLCEVVVNNFLLENRRFLLSDNLLENLRIACLALCFQVWTARPSTAIALFLTWLANVLDTLPICTQKGATSYNREIMYVLLAPSTTLTVPRAGVIARMCGKPVCEENGMCTVCCPKSGVFGIPIHSRAIGSKLDYSELGASRQNGETSSVVCFLREREVIS